MMKLDVSGTAFPLGESRAFSFVISSDSLDLGECAEHFRGEIRVNGSVMNTGSSLRVVGTVGTCRSFVCDRCLAEGERQIALDFSEDYAKTPGETDEAVLYDGESIVLDDLVRDTLLVAEPLRELCKSDCKGLCPICGQNLNEGMCDCDAFVRDPRLAALESLFKND